MPVILLEKDPFAEVLQDNKAVLSAGGELNVRRPLWGIVQKKNTFAYLSIYQSISGGEPTPISLIDSSAPGGYSLSNHNFFLQDVQDQRQEKFQLIPTFGPYYVFFYGKQPVILQCSGLLLNTDDFNWKNEFLNNYENYLRGTKCVENQARVYMGFDDVIVEGYIIACSVAYNKDLPYLCPFTFQLLVTNYQDVSEPIVTKAEEARQVGGTSGMPETSTFQNQSTSLTPEAQALNEELGYESLDQLKYVEYLSDLWSEGVWEVDPSTGVSKHASEGTGDIPAGIDEWGMAGRTASWVSEHRPVRKQWLEDGEALTRIDLASTQQQQGSDAVSVRQKMKKDASAFPLTSRNQASRVGASLTTGVCNSTIVVADSPKV